MKNTQKKNFQNYQEKWFLRLHELYLSKQSLPGLYQDFYFHLAGNLLRKFLATLNKFKNNSMKHYYMNADKNCCNFELCNPTLHFRLHGHTKSSCFEQNNLILKCLKDSAEALALTLFNLINFSIKQPLFSDQFNFLNLKKALIVTRKNTGPIYHYLLYLR